jgi:hypothetical protein
MSSHFNIQSLQFNESAINTELVPVSITEPKFGILNLQAISSPLNETNQEFVFTVDCSGSMSDGCADGRTKMQHIVHTIKNMLLYFKENSIKAFVTINAFDDKIYNIIQRTNITDENFAGIISSVDKIVPRTNTNIEKALESATESIAQIKTEFPEHNISHILMTDGEVTTGNKDPEFLSQLVDTSVTNIFIGFGVEHDTTLLNRLGSGAKCGYYFIDKLENCGIVYGEVLHGVLYKLLFDVTISIQNGLIYDFKNNVWVSSIFIGEIVSESNKFYHIASQTPTECIISFTGKNIIDLTELSFTITGEQTDIDLTKFIYRQRTLQHLFTVNDYLKRKNTINNSLDYNNYKNNLFILPIQPENEALKEERKTIKTSLLEFINEMKQFMTDKQLTDDAFMKNLCDDIYICYKTFETKFGAMYVGARQTSQGTQRAYTVSHTPSDDNNKFALNDFIGYDTNISQKLTPRINRNNNCFNCTNLPTSIDDMLDDTSILQHELSHFDQAPYLTPTSTRLMREISSNTSAADFQQEEESQNP